MIFKFLFLQAYHLVNKDIHKLEYDAGTQYNFHRVMAVLWIIFMIIVPFMHAFASNIVGTLIMEVSLYANFATEFGSMSAAEAAMGQPVSGNSIVTPNALPGTVAPEVKINNESSKRR